MPYGKKEEIEQSGSLHLSLHFSFYSCFSLCNYKINNQAEKGQIILHECAGQSDSLQLR